MRLTIDHDTLAFLLDLPDDIDITSVESAPEGAIIIASAPDHYPAEATPLYGTDDDGNVSLLGFSAPE